LEPVPRLALLSGIIRSIVAVQPAVQLSRGLLANQCLGIVPTQGELEDEVRRYQMLRLSSRIGFKPPYFYNRSLRNRSIESRPPTLVIWVKRIIFVRGQTAKLMRIQFRLAANKNHPSAGHSVHAEKPRRQRIGAGFLAK